MSALRNLRDRLSRPGPLLVGGAHDALSAKLVEEAGVDTTRLRLVVEGDRIDTTTTRARLDRLARDLLRDGARSAVQRRRLAVRVHAIRGRCVELVVSVMEGMIGGDLALAILTRTKARRELARRRRRRRRR